MKESNNHLLDSAGCLVEKNLHIAIDFDGTITNYRPYPNIGSINRDALKYIPLLRKQGFKLILHTARSGEYYREAIHFLEKYNLFKYFDFSDSYLRGEKGKPVAIYYIDDRSIPGKLNWKKAYKFIIKNWGDKK